MISNYSFKDIQKYLEKDSKIGRDILDAVDSLTDAAIYRINVDIVLTLFETLEICLLRQVVTFDNRRLLVKILAGFVNYSKDEINKSMDYSIRVATSKLLDLLIPNGMPITINEKISFDHVFYKNLLIDDEWGNDYEGSIHYSLRYFEDGIIGVQNNINKSFPMSLLDIIDNSINITSEDRINILLQLTYIDNLSILLETNPELVSRAILMLIEMDTVGKYVNTQIIDIFLDQCLHLVTSVGIFNFGLNSVINVIKIAKHFDAKDFLFEMKALLERKIFYRSPDFLAYIIYQYPDFFASLMDMFPILFVENERDVFHDISKLFFFRKKLLYNIESKKVLEYLRILHTMSLYIDKKSNYKRDMLDVLQNFSRIMLKFKNFDKLDLNQLTIMQFDDLIWLLESVDDVEFAKYLKEKLRRSNVFNYFPHTFFESSDIKKKKRAPFS